jgi:hypothetical protein
MRGKKYSPQNEIRTKGFLVKSKKKLEIDNTFNKLIAKNSRASPSNSTAISNPKNSLKI